MSHKSGGYFYCSYGYQGPWTSEDGTTGTDTTYYSALYTPSARQDHEAQNQWYKNTFLPAAEQDITKNFFGDANRNENGRTYAPYTSGNIKVLEFKWTDNPPKHTDGPLKGQIYGKQI